MADQVVVDKVAVTKPGDTGDTIVHKGEMLPDWVSDFTRFVLRSTGMAKLVEQPDPAVLAEANPPAPVVLAEHAPAPGAAATQPDGAARAGRNRGSRKPVADSTTKTGGEKTPPDATPARNASTEDWVAYAVSQRAEDVSEQDAEAAAKELTRAELIDKFGNADNGN